MNNELTLQTAVNRLNAQGCYVNRYQIFRSLDGSVALFKCVGKMNLNISGWHTESAVLGYVNGHIEGYDAAQRRAEAS